jgi:colicin import membrane protein
VAAQQGNQGTDNSLLGRYQVVIQQAVRQNWLRPESTRPGIVCVLSIVQIPGGEVIQASVSTPCNADALTRRSIEAAVLKAQPLPYRGFESVFRREIRFTFRYDGE